MGSLGAVVAEDARAKPRALVVFDYDCSLVNDDSDALFCRSLCPELTARLHDMPPHTAPPNGWPALMDELFGIFCERNPHVTRDEIERIEAEIAVFPETLDAIRLAVDEYDATAAIISDSNTVFIGSMLEHHKLRDRVPELHTNRGVWEDQGQGRGPRLRVQPYHAPDEEPHGCAICPANMCKGRILDMMRAKQAYDVVFYVGDGIGDFCPSTRLTSRDTVLARADGADGKAFGLLHRIRQEPHKVQARVVEWNAGSDIYACFESSLRAMAESSVET